MKRKNRKGFTLIEMLVVVAVIAALSVALGVSATQMMANSQKNDYEETYKEIIKNARIYVEIENSINLTNGGSVDFTLGKMIAKGLQDEKILSENNPALAVTDTFKENMKINVKLTNTSTDKGRKIVSIYTGVCTITSDNIEDVNWGKC